MIADLLACGMPVWLLCLLLAPWVLAAVTILGGISYYLLQRQSDQDHTLTSEQLDPRERQ